MVFKQHTDSPSTKVSISVVIPAHNAARYIRGTLAAILMNKLVKQVVIVDDCSTDETVASVEKFARLDKRLKLIRLSHNQGAGAARNQGAKYITEPYCVFIDADDFLTEKALDEGIPLLHDQGADFLVYKWLPADMNGVITGQSMPSHEEKLWDKALAGEIFRKTDARNAPSILRILNYPWNKIYRTDFFRKAGIRYSTTFVHNDNLAHWMSFVQANSFVLYGKYLIMHKQDVRRSQVSTIMDQRRLQLFDAFDDVDDFFTTHVEHDDLYPLFCCYKRDLFRGISLNLHDDIIPEFAKKTAKSLKNIDSTLFFRICSLDLSAAKDIYDMRYDPMYYYTWLREIVFKAVG